MDAEDHKLNSEETKRLATQAKELKEDPAFVAAVLALRKQWFGQLMAMHDEKGVLYLTMQLQSLEAIPAQLQVFINDWEMVKRRQHNG